MSCYAKEAFNITLCKGSIYSASYAREALLIQSCRYTDVGIKQKPLLGENCQITQNKNMPINRRVLWPENRQSSVDGSDDALSASLLGEFLTVGRKLWCSDESAAQQALPIHQLPSQLIL